MLLSYSDYKLLQIFAYYFIQYNYIKWRGILQCIVYSSYCIKVRVYSTDRETIIHKFHVLQLKFEASSKGKRAESLFSMTKTYFDWTLKVAQNSFS